MRPVIVLLLAGLIFARAVHAGIRINEIYPAPSKGQFEWVELINDSPVEASLSAYRLTDAKGNKITLPTSIGAGAFVEATAEAVLNNDGDSVILSGPDGDAMSYAGPFDSSHSYARCPTGWIITAVVTKQAPNDAACAPTPTLPPSPTPSPVPPDTPTRTPTPKPTAKLTPIPSAPIPTIRYAPSVPSMAQVAGISTASATITTPTLTPTPQPSDDEPSRPPQPPTHPIPFLVPSLSLLGLLSSGAGIVGIMRKMNKP